MKALLIVASGKSSRFGGNPKAFCKIGDSTNVQNTINLTRNLYDKVYVALNHRIYNDYADLIEGATVLRITMGQGDAHSLLKCLRLIQNENKNIEHLTVCWGDAFFLDRAPFDQILDKADIKKAPVWVAVSVDQRPYAWFETTENMEIIKSHFAKKEGFVEKGIHDQSLFLFDLSYGIFYLNEYRKSLKVPEENDDDFKEENEMKLLYSFEFLNHVNKENRARCIMIDAGKVLSFNTIEELEEIRRIWNTKSAGIY